MASLAGTYARAFADVIAEQHVEVARALQELHTVAALMQESDDLRRVWENPSIPGEQKRKVVDALAARDWARIEALASKAAASRTAVRSG